MNTIMANTTAEYFGLKVDVLCVMKNCSLIRFESKEFIADTADLELGQILEQAA